MALHGERDFRRDRRRGSWNHRRLGVPATLSGERVDGLHLSPERDVECGDPATGFLRRVACGLWWHERLTSPVAGGGYGAVANGETVEGPGLRRRKSFHNSLTHNTALAGMTHFTQSVKESAVVPNACCSAGK